MMFERPESDGTANTLYKYRGYVDPMRVAHLQPLSRVAEVAPEDEAIARTEY